MTERLHEEPQEGSPISNLGAPVKWQEGSDIAVKKSVAVMSLSPCSTSHCTELCILKWGTIKLRGVFKKWWWYSGERRGLSL